MEGEHQRQRSELAEQIKQAPKDKRREILDSAKSKDGYWQAKSERAKGFQEEEPIDEGLGVFVKKKTLYHGSGTEGITALNKAEEDTVGSGVYFTSEAKDAIGYARYRAEERRGRVPVIYEVSVENMKLLDLRKDENVKHILPQFRERLFALLKKPDLPWTVDGAIREVLEAIDKGKVGGNNVKEVAQKFGVEFSEYIKAIGFEGLVTLEGGEGEIGNHDSYVIFDPEKAKITQAHKIM